jgi:hypothetical protein
MQQGVPGIEWDGVITKKGPFNMEGVGDIVASTRDEWMVLAPLPNGDMQAVRCHSMYTVTATFPRYNTTKAVAQVKEDAPDNAELQDCCVLPEIGGEIDCLMGIKYGTLSPEPIHTLVGSGLGIYRSKLRSYDDVSNAIIVGTQESFEYFASLAGRAAPLISLFTAGLHQFRVGKVKRGLLAPIMGALRLDTRKA